MSKAETVTIKKRLVTPHLAEQWLGKNADNRNASKASIDAYARDMRAGDWKFTGDAIRFNCDGTLIDGQQRLAACIKANKAFEVLVMTGLSAEVRSVIDTGRGRRPSDALKFEGHVSCTSLAAACVWLYTIKLGSDSRLNRLTSSEILHMAKRHPRLSNSVGRVFAPGSQRIALGPRPTLCMAMHYIGSQLLKQPERADAMLEVLQTGKPDYKGDPMQMWREQLVRLRSRGASVTRMMHLIGTMHAWNGFAKKERFERFLMPSEAVAIDGLDTKKI